MVLGTLFSSEFTAAPPGRTQNKRLKPPPPKPDLNLSCFADPSSERTYVGQNVYIRPSYVVSIPEFSYSRKYSSVAFHENKKNLQRNNHNGLLSAKAISNIKNAINWMLISARSKKVFSIASQSSFRFKVGFVTLTLPDSHKSIDNATFTKQLLNPFLVYLRKYHQLKNYVWKMELQQNGKLHCHITIDTFVHWRDIRKTWNRLLYKNSILDKFIQDHGHSDPNSTDVHSVKKIKNLAAYLSKYMAKNQWHSASYEGAEYSYIPKINGRIWGCNYELSRAKNCSVHIPAPEVIDEMRSLHNSDLRVKELSAFLNGSLTAQKFGEVFFLSAKDWGAKVSGAVRAAFDAMKYDIMSVSRHFSNYELSL